MTVFCDRNRAVYRILRPLGATCDLWDCRTQYFLEGDGDLNHIMKDDGLFFLEILTFHDLLGI